VLEFEPKLRHLAFFEELASLDESDPAWNAATAGLVVLRLVDAWLENGPNTSLDDDWPIRSVRTAIDEVHVGATLRALLGRVVDALEERKPDIHVVVTPLMAYGQALEYDAKWTLAADVYTTVLAHLHPIEDSDASIAAHLRLGSCYRNLQLIDQASKTYACVAEIAGAVGDMVGILRGRIGEAQIAWLRGNLPQAGAILDDTIAKAASDDMKDVRSRALHDRSSVANITGQYELGVRLAYEALGCCQNPTERDRILTNIANSFVYLGVLSAARDAYLVLSATAQEQYTRWVATLNLLDVAAQSGAETLFEQYRRQLRNEQLPPFFATAFELTLGTGYRRFGDLAKARPHLQRAVAMAGEHGLNQFLFEAEEALYQLETHTPPRSVQRDMPHDIEEVARAMRDLRESAGVT